MNTKLYLFITLLFLSLLFSPLNVVYANEVTTCGNDFSNAVELQEGENTGGVINENSTCYYFFNSKSGYELDVRYKITGEGFFGFVSLYNSEKTEIVTSIDVEDTLKWLGADLTPTKYYLVVKNSYRTNSQLYDVTLVDRTDAMSKTDAGGDFNSALGIKYGEYTGSLSSFVSGSTGGNDNSDYYRLAVKKGDDIEIKVEPTGDFEVGCAVYDSNRSELFNEDGLDLEVGQIIQKTFEIQSDGYIYVVVKQSSYGEKWGSIDQYTLLITNQSIEKVGGEIAIDQETENNEEESTIVTDNTKGIIIKLAILALAILVVVFIVLLVIRMGKKNKKQSNEKSIFESKKIETEDKSQNKVKVTVEEGTDVEINTVETKKEEKDKSVT